MAQSRHRHVTLEALAEPMAAPVEAWWQARYGEFTPPQRLAIPAIASGGHTLLCAPTGTGKTMAAFLTVFSELWKRYLSGNLPIGVACVYLSPLRALGADITENLLEPLSQIAASQGITSPIRVALRTGDATPAQRQKLLRHPPHILITTPETLALGLVHPLMREHLSHVQTIIVDELHSLAPSKRGVDMALSLERLSDWVRRCHPDPQRIGLSATMAPLEAMADFLVGPRRVCQIADASRARRLELTIFPPFSARGLLDQLEARIRRNRTTLVFGHVRSTAEQLAYRLRERFSESPESIQVHHSSLDRGVRQRIEGQLKAGELRCVVTSTSLELGVDIGAIDEVVLLGSPKGVSRGLQRIGRSGHGPGQIARGVVMPRTPAELLESLVTGRMMRRGQLDSVALVRVPMDVLCQQLLGMALEDQGFDPQRAYELVCRCESYRGLSRETFQAAISYLSGESGGDASLAARLEIDSAGRLRMNHHRYLYLQNTGTMVSEGFYSVCLEEQEGLPLGTLPESYAQKLKPGDRFVLAGRCLVLLRRRGGELIVAYSEALDPTVPRWDGGAMGIGSDLAAEIRGFRREIALIAPRGIGSLGAYLREAWEASEAVSLAGAEFLWAQWLMAGIPTGDRLVVERVPDQESVVLLFHTLLGRAAHEALSRVVGYRLFQRQGSNPTVVVDDEGFGVWVPAGGRRGSRQLLRELLNPAGFDADLGAALEASELFESEFRHTCVRAQAILRQNGAARRSLSAMSTQATRLLEALQSQSPDHLLLAETRRTLREDRLSASEAQAYLQRQVGEPLEILDLPGPSPLAMGLFFAARRDTLDLADPSDFLMALHQQLQHRLGATGPAECPPA